MYPRIEGTAQARLKVKVREEKPFSETSEGPRLTSGSSILVYEGDLEGEAVLEEVRVHFTDKRAGIYGVQRFAGRLKDLQGSFVLHLAGQVREGAQSSTLTVIPGSGTGGLKGLRGEMRLSTLPGEILFLVFHYHFA